MGSRIPIHVCPRCKARGSNVKLYDIGDGRYHSIIFSSTDGVCFVMCGDCLVDLERWYDDGK